MFKFTKFLIFISILTVLLIPVFQLSAEGLVPCATVANPEPCEFKHVMILINTVIRFILFVLVLPIAAIMFAYAGFLLLTSGGDSSRKTKAKNIFTNVLIGVIIAVAAWLIVKTFLSILGYDGGWIGF